MCLICVEYNKNRDLNEMKDMIDGAISEPKAIPEEHLSEVVKEYIRLRNLQELFRGVINGSIKGKA